MNFKAMKIAPLFFILLMTLSAITYTPAAITSNSTTTNPQIHFVPSPPIGSTWVNDSNAYATYNGHFGSDNYRSYPYSDNRSDMIITANMNVTNLAPTSSNISVHVFEFFTGAYVPEASDLWYQINTVNGLVTDTNGHQTGLYNYPEFFYLPNVNTYHIGDHVQISTPFSNMPLDFRVNRTETILGVPTIQLVNSSSFSSLHNSNSMGVLLWFSNDTAHTGVLMRIIGHQWDWSEYYDSLYFLWIQNRHSMDMSMEIGTTNIITLIPPEIPEGIVPWMGVGKFIQYDIQGSASIDASITNHTAGVTWQLPGDTKFRATVSATLTLKVVKGTTAWVDPWNSTRYLWVLNLTLSNTKILLPDLRRTIDYVNSTFHPEGMPTADQILSILGSFNKTGPVVGTWFLADNATGIMLWPGMHLDALSTFSPSMSGALGDLLAQGLGFQILSYFAQSVLYQGWSISNPPSTQTINIVNTLPQFTQTVTGTAMASITAVGTEYLNFPGGGGGLCWRLEPRVNMHVTESTIFNRTNPPSWGFSNLIMANSTNSLTSSGYIDVERTSGFPLAFLLSTTFSTTNDARFMPYFWYSDSITVQLDLSATVPDTNIWFSNPPVYLTMGLGGGNLTSPTSTFGKYGFDVWMNGVTSGVSVTSSASQPPNSTAPPGGQLPFVYLDIKGVPLGSGNIILYVFYNRTKVQQLNIVEDSLKLYTFNISAHQWEELASTHLTINATHGVIFAVLPHLSYFAVLGASPTGGIPSLYVIIAAAAVIAVLAAVVYIKKGKGKGGLSKPAL